MTFYMDPWPPPHRCQLSEQLYCLRLMTAQVLWGLGRCCPLVTAHLVGGVHWSPPIPPGRLRQFKSYTAGEFQWHQWQVLVVWRDQARPVSPTVCHLRKGVQMRPTIRRQKIWENNVLNSNASLSKGGKTHLNSNFLAYSGSARF